MNMSQIGDVAKKISKEVGLSRSVSNRIAKKLYKLAGNARRAVKVGERGTRAKLSGARVTTKQRSKHA